ncbi:MAG: ribonuclease [Clostridia bacterium]|nr:ribonuclease [Clostridia bacterium]
MKRILAVLLALLLGLAVFASAEEIPVYEEILVDGEYVLTEDGELEYGLSYTSPGDVALYLYVFAELPSNFITKAEARDLGWDNRLGNLWDVAYGMSIGGDVFGNREGLLPKERGRTWYECDVNYDGGYRGGERLLFSSDGLICYSGDHYNSYTVLYEGWYEGSGWNEAA